MTPTPPRRRRVDPDDLVGILDIAHKIGKSRNYVSQLGRRHFLPEPVTEISGHPVFLWSEVERALKIHGKIPLD
jgi:hypothetical protein